MRPGETESPPASLWGHIRRELGRRWVRSSASLFLLIAMIVVLLLGAQMGQFREDPKRFAFYLSLLFIFFLIAIARAVVDFLELAREHLRARERLFGDTFGRDGFSEELGRRVSKGEPGSWPE